MTTEQLLTGNGAAAWGARLAAVDYIPAFPITPQTEIIETLAQWIEQRRMAGRLVLLDSEHSMVTAAGAAAATGVRVFSATSSQGLLYAMEMLYAVAGWRVPLVLVNVSRGISAPITLEPDHTDVMASRDSGFLQLHCATCQEVLDSLLIAYRLAEDPRLRLPLIVNLDGFYLSFTREPVLLPTAEQVSAFLPSFDPQPTLFRADQPRSQAVAVLDAGAYSYFRYQIHLASRQALGLYDQIGEEFGARFGRSYTALECYRCDDADWLFVMIGSFATKAKAAVDRLRRQGCAVGLVRPRLVRPFPDQALQHCLQGRRGVAVIDQNLSMGHGGVLYHAVRSALYDAPSRPLVAGYVGGLGGRDICHEEFAAMIRELQRAEKNGVALPPRLLLRRGELEGVRRLQQTAREAGGNDD